MKPSSLHYYVFFLFFLPFIKYTTVVLIHKYYICTVVQKRYRTQSDIFRIY